MQHSELGNHHVNMSTQMQTNQKNVSYLQKLLQFFISIIGRMNIQVERKISLPAEHDLKGAMAG